MSIHKTQAIVLRRYDVRETSIIVNFYTSDFGKITGILKGIRSDPRKFGSSVSLFSLNDIVFYRKRNSPVHLVSQCDLKEDFIPLRKSVAKITLASMAMEIVDSVMEAEDANAQVFSLTQNTLAQLALTDNPEKIITIFKIKLLALSGFKPHLDSCLVCGNKVLGHAKFSVRMGGLLCPHCCGKDSSARVIFRGTVATILHIEKNDFLANLNLGMNLEIKKELEHVLNAFLNFHLGKELKSQKVLDKMDYFIPTTPPARCETSHLAGG